MTCPAFGSTSNITLFYALDPDPSLPLPNGSSVGEAFTWYEMPVASESLTAELTSSISDRITESRAYFGSVITQGQVSGSVTFELSTQEVLYNLIIAMLGHSKDLTFTGSETDPWANSQIIGNAPDVPKCLTILKRVRRAYQTTWKYDWYVFRGVRVSGMTLDVNSGEILKTTFNFIGIKPDAPRVDIARPAHWTLNTLALGALTPTLSDDTQFRVRDQSDTDLGFFAQNASFSFDSALSQQWAIGGGGGRFASGIREGRFSATASMAIYYKDPSLYTAMLNDTAVKIQGVFRDSDGKGLNIELPYAKITSGGIVVAGGPDQDAIVQTEFRGFESPNLPSVRFTKVDPP
jgi:hypothetical protein